MESKQLTHVFLKKKKKKTDTSLTRNSTKWYYSNVLGKMNLWRLERPRGGKVNPNSFAHLNPPTLIESKSTQLLVRLNGH